MLFRALLWVTVEALQWVTVEVIIATCSYESDEGQTAEKLDWSAWFPRENWNGGTWSQWFKGVLHSMEGCYIPWRDAIFWQDRLLERWVSYRRRFNYASFLILRQNATFQTGNFQWCVTLRKLIFYCCVTRISWLQMWTVVVACHRWCVKLRHIRDMAETSLVVRDGNGNRNSSPKFVFSNWGHSRIPHVSKNMDAS